MKKAQLTLAVTESQSPGGLRQVAWNELHCQGQSHPPTCLTRIIHES